MKIHNTLSSFLMAICLLVFLPEIQATHIVGGEMNYRCLGNDQYEISLTIFRDCDTGDPWFDDPAAIGIFSGSTNVYLRQVFVDTLGNNNDTIPIFLPDSCIVVPSNVCIHTMTYRTIVTLPFIQGGYTLAYQRCCRNQDIVNIVGPNSTGATYSISISEQALLTCNSSPVFKEWPRVYLCSGIPISFDHSAIDIDGDSIVYEMCTPHDGASNASPAPQPPNAPPYLGITWQSFYNVNDQFGNPADPLAIDPQTGELTGTPQNLGVFLVGICAKEYRNGVLISTTRRDFQHLIGTCQRYVEADLDTVPLFCNKDLRYFFLNQSNIVSGSFGTHIWQFDTLGTSTVDNPFFIFPDTGQYTIKIIAGVGSPCVDTAELTIDAQIRDIDLTISGTTEVCQGDSIWLSVANLYEGYADSVGYRWFPDSEIISGQGTDSVLVVVNQNTLFTVEGTNNYGCTDATAFNVNAITVAAEFITLIPPCNTSLTVPFANNSTSNPASNSYQWNFANLGTATLTNPTFTFPDTGTYTIQLIAGSNTICPDTSTQVLRVAIEGVNLTSIPDRTVCQGDSIWMSVDDLFDAYSTTTNYAWSPAGQILQGQGTDSVLVFASAATAIQVTATNNYGCTDSRGTQIRVEQVTAAFDTTVASCNTSLIVEFQNNSTSNPTTNNYQWNFANIGNSINTNPTFAFPDTGNYAITLIAGVGTLCPDTLTQALYLPLFGMELTAIADETLCQGDSVWVVIDDLFEDYSDSTIYTWSPAGQILQGQGTDSVLVLASAATQLQVVGLNEHGCSDNQSSTIDVVTVTADFDTTNLQCNTSLTIPFTNNSASSLTAIDYQWNFGGVANSTATNPSYSFPDTGTYNIQLIAGVGSLCPDTTEQLVYLPLQGIDVSATDALVVCQGDTVLLTASNTFANYTAFTNFDWTPAAFILSGQGTDSVWAIVDTSMTFNVTAINSHNCRDTTTATGMIQYIRPIVNISTNPDSVFVGQSVQLDATTNINYTYDWLADTTLSDYYIPNPTAKPRGNTTYYLNTSNQYGCVDFDSITIYIKPSTCISPIVFIPNAFTPDGDGYNDVLKVEGNNITELEFVVYNRWGQKVFETSNQSVGWDGTFKGRALAPDIYGYYIKCRCDDGSELFKKGNITLLK